FVQDKDLVSPLGVAVIGDKVAVSCSPNLIVYTRDLKTDAVLKKEILLTGFGGFDHDHSLHKVHVGPDGKWYFNTGNAGPHIVTDKSGWTLRAGSFYTGGSPYNKTNTPGLKSDDGRIYTGGVFLRVNPDGTKLEVLGHGHRNPYGMAVDSFGELWGDDNDDTQSCRVTWLMKYGDLGYNSKDGTRSWQADRRPGQSIPTAHWRQEDPGVIPSGHVYGNGSPTGMAYYEGGALGDKFAGGLLLSCEAGQNVIWGYHRKPQGAGFALEPFPFLRSIGEQDPNYKWNKKEDDRRKWFRPSDVTIGTDGCVYVADWYDQIVGGHQMEDKTATGFIYRIGPKGRKAEAPKYDGSTVAGAIEMLKSPAAGVREMGRQRLASPRSDAEDLEVRARISAMETKQSRPFESARAVWLFDERPTAPATSDAAVVLIRRILSAGTDAVELAKTSVGTAFPPANRELALAMRDLPVEKCRDVLVKIAAAYDGKDRWYLEALGTGCEGKEEAMYATLLGVMGSQPLKWSDAFADIAWRLHPVTAVPPLKDRAMSDSITPARRKQAIDAIGFVADKLAATAMGEIAAKGPGDLREYAQWWLNSRAKNDWKEFDVKTTGGTAASAGGETGVEVFASPVVKKGHVDIDVDIADAKRVTLLADDAGDGNTADWANWVDGVLVSPTGQVKLTELKPVTAETGWAEIGIDKNCKGGPLRIGGVTYDNGVGGHARMRLVYDVAGKGFTRLKVRAGVDNGGPEAGGSEYKGGTVSSVRFRVYVDGPSPKDKALALKKRLLDPTLKPGERDAAAIALATSAEGGKILLSMAEEKTIPDSLKGLVTLNISRNPDLGVRAQAAKHFPRKTMTGEAYPSIDELMKLDGDAVRGKAVFLVKQTQCATCHKVGNEGKELGPDLSKIGAKFDRRAMFDQILNPSATILSGYEGWLIELKDGDSVMGFIVADGETVVLKDTLGQEQQIAKQEITNRRQLELSIMPNDIALLMKPQELADLVSYLESLK
ncbi:MAG TPA: PVC-type heme-binding CxxCH protein, partial [Tepidisphaeraceae bacterium]|nr:PVC-type heme-binding CxxCH protein [Tepidisphaeraceae bacterium]